MRMLGPKSSISSFRWDLIYLKAQLAADDRQEVNGLAALAGGQLSAIAAERDALEQAEDAAIVASALLNKKDRRRDGVLIEAGGMARALDRPVYATLFPQKSPSATAKLGIDAESVEVRRILGELGKLPAVHPVRNAYETELAEVEAAVQAAGAQSDQAVTALALQRSQIDRFKLATDQLRLEIHGRLVAILKDKVEADAFFRPTTAVPGTKETAPPEEPAPLEKPAVPPPA